MSDRWLNTGYPSVMTPYREPYSMQLNETYVAQMIRLGFTEVDLMNSVVSPGFNHVYATYNLLSEMFKRQPKLVLPSLCLFIDLSVSSCDLINFNIYMLEDCSLALINYTRFWKPVYLLLRLPCVCIKLIPCRRI